MGAVIAVSNRWRGAQVAPMDDNSVVSLTSSQESLLKEIQNQNGNTENVAVEEITDFIYPPMPTMGSSINIQVLVDRNNQMHKRFQEATFIVSKTVGSAIKEASTVPVADATSRVLVSEEITDRMRTVRTRKQIRLAREININEIQQSLTIRMRIHEIMNNNSSRVLVNKAEPIFIKEARGDVVYIDEEEEYEDEEW